jgi:DNA-binding NarL/FixJ family response regulator
VSVTYRVLLVDDHEGWRRFITSTLQKKTPRWQVIEEASDGLSAVEKARALQPDLILLDVGLPKLNGIEVANRILAEAPRSTILFMSEHRSPDIVEAALATGAAGYLVKSDAGVGLLPAMSAVVGGGRYISADVAARGSMSLKGREPGGARTVCHRAAFYSDEVLLLDDCAQFAEGVLADGAAFIVCAIPSRQALLQQRLEARGVDVDLVTREGRFRSFHVADLLSNVMVGHTLDDARFRTVVTPMISEAVNASKERGRVALWGECAPSLWRAGNPEAAIRLEHLWDDVAKRHDIDTLCGYLAPAMSVDDSSYQRLCVVHTAVHAR